MGVNWVRATLPRASSLDRLEALVEQQAIASQSMWGWSSLASSDYDAVRRALNERLHLDAYRAASDAFFECLSFPDWDDARNCPSDIPELAASWRVSAITNNPIFPPLWRLQANRTLLPESLRLQIGEWRQWIEQVVGGKIDLYLSELHLCATSDFMHYHWSYLRGNAWATLKQNGDWAKSPDLAELREKILRLSEPVVIEAWIDPLDDLSAIHNGRDVGYGALYEDLAILLELTRAWNSIVHGDWAIPDYEENYARTLDDFKEKARDPWLLEFLRWAGDCVDQGLALYLEY
ncbi:hypothetical protein ACYOEI_07690 [Singulisphaera rosea]